MSNPMEYDDPGPGAQEDSDPYGGPPGYGGSQAPPPYPEVVPGAAGDDRGNGGIRYTRRLARSAATAGNGGMTRYRLPGTRSGSWRNA